MSDYLLKQAIERFDMRSYAMNLGVAAEMPNGELIVGCPTCGKEKLCVNPKKRTWHCWVCEEYGPADAFGRRLPVKGAGGLVALIQLMESVDKRTAVERVLSIAAFTSEELAQIPEGDLKAGFLELADSANPIQPPEGLVAVNGILPYMHRRGITLEDAQMFGLGWCSHGRYANRLVFPVWERGQLVYFQARAMWEEAEHTPRFPEDRYIKALNPGRRDGAAVSSEVLMNLDQARAFPRVAIVEGPMDAVKAGPSAVCTFGKKISATQVAKLLRAGVKALDFMWDGPSPTEPHGAWPEMFAAAPMLGALFDLRLVFLPSGDPGQRSRTELDWHRAHGRPWPIANRLEYV